MNTNDVMVQLWRIANDEKLPFDVTHICSHALKMVMRLSDEIQRLNGNNDRQASEGIANEH